MTDIQAPRTTNLILIGGLAAAGKTTLGRELALITKFAFLDKDTVTQPLVEALLSALNAPGGADDRQSDTYLRGVRSHEYQSFMDVVVENVSLGVSTIAVAPFVREMTAEKWLGKLQQQLPDAIIHKLWITPAHNLLYERMRGRGSARDWQKLDNWAEYVASCRTIRPSGSCVVIEPVADERERDLAERVLRLIGLA